MENASRALLMAAGVLIGILILSLAVYLFVTFGASSAQMHKQIEENRLNEFNSQFTVLEGKDDVTIYDVATIANLAKDNNNYYNLDTKANNNFYIKVSLDRKGVYSPDYYSLEKENMEKVIKEESLIEVTDEDGVEYKRLPTYECKVYINQNTRRVDEVKFTEKTL